MSDEQTFDPAFGSPLLLRPEGVEQDLRTFFIGMEPHQYVICSLGKVLDDAGVLSALRDKTRRTRLFYLREGIMRGFTVRILGFKTTPFRHLLLSFPETAQTFNLRSHDRVDCHLPARVADGASAARGMISNISAGGCRLSMACAPMAHPWLQEGENYDLAMQLPTQDNPLPCLCSLALRQHADHLVHLGLRFLHFEPEYADQVTQFIEHVSKYRI
ncbi:MAG: PilZ domain-containing protein [Desulfovibrio sp.]|jgi:hypothetical protein|nr:PilZ domain-containing protein [Desulfovibrio sp.]